MRRAKPFKAFLALLFILPSTGVWAQSEVPAVSDELILLEIEERLQTFLDEWNMLASDIQFGPADNISDMDARLKRLEAKWNTYSQSVQMDIANDDSLLETVGSIQVAQQTAEELLGKRKTMLQMQDSFGDAERAIAGMDSTYDRMSKMAAKLSLVKQAAPQLEKLKAKEQMLFADIQAHYDAAKAAAEAIPALQERMKKLEERYVALKSISEKIQAAEYKPWIARAKDYLLGIAAVCIILMFVSMIMAKVKAIKQAREAAKKLQQMLPENNQQYPTI